MGIIRDQQLSLLQTEGNENITFKVFDKDGFSQGTTTKDVLVSCPSILQPIDEDLLLEYLPPLRDAIKTTNIYDLIIVNQNPNFRYGTYNWDITASLGEIVMPDIVTAGNVGGWTVTPLSGYYTLQQKAIEVSENKTTHLVKNNLSESILIQGKEIEITFNYFIYKPGPRGTKMFFNIQVGVDNDKDGVIEEYYNFEDGKWEIESTPTENKWFDRIEVNDTNQWVKFKKTIKPCLPNFINTTGGVSKIEVKLFPMNGGTVLFPSSALVFYDSLVIAQKTGYSRIEQKKVAIRFQDIAGLQTEVTENVSGSYEMPKSVLTNVIDSDIINGLIPSSFTRLNRGDNAYLDDLILIEKLNDFRSAVKRYEGYFYKKDISNVPINLFNKLWINFGVDLLQDPVSCIIDHVEYNVKKNIYMIRFHMSNQDDPDQININNFKLDDDQVGHRPSKPIWGYT